jgi:hypothetical protein
MKCLFQGGAWAPLLAIFLAHCGTTPSAACPVGEELDGSGQCVPVNDRCLGNECLDAGVDGGDDASVPACENETDCDDGSECTTDACDGGSCTNTAELDGLACDFGGVQGICSSGVCEDAGLCLDVDCSDGVDCTDDICVDGVCTQHIPNNLRCNDGDSCTDNICNDVAGCTHPQLANYTLCDDGAAATGPDLCNAGACIGATRGEINAVGEAVDIVKAGAVYVALLNQTNDAAVFAIDDPSSHRSLGSTKGIGHRLHARGSDVYVGGEFRDEATCGEFNTCALIGVSDDGGSVQWSGTPFHTEISGLALSSIRDINSFTDTAAVICQFPPCASPVYWWFVGQRLGTSATPRPHAVFCEKPSANVLGCKILSTRHNSGSFDNQYFAGIEISTAGNIQDIDYNQGIFGINKGDEASLLIDDDGDPDNSLDAVDTGSMDVDLRGSVRLACNRVIQYGDGGSSICQAPNLQPSPFFGCEAGTPWTCASLIAGRNFVHGTVAGKALLVTPTALYINASGSSADPNNWMRVDFGLDSGVQLAAAAGDNNEWYILASDSNSGKVKIFHFGW